MSTPKRRFKLFPKKLTDCIEPVAKEALKQRGFSEMRLFKEWRYIVGEECAKRCIPEKLSFPKGAAGGGTLTILVSGNWALQLQHLEPIILERIATFFGYRLVTRMSIKQGVIAVDSTSAKHSPERPLTPQNLLALSEVTEGIEDEALRASILSLGKSLASNNKMLNNA